MLLRRNDSDAGAGSWAALVDKDGKTRWITKLPDVTPGARRINQGVTVAGDTATVSYGASDRGVVALSLDDGSERWRSTTVQAEQLIGAVGDEDQVFQVYWREESDSYVRSLDRKTGDEQWMRHSGFSNWDWVHLSDDVLWFAPHDSGARAIAR